MPSPPSTPPTERQPTRDQPNRDHRPQEPPPGRIRQPDHEPGADTNGTAPIGTTTPVEGSGRQVRAVIPPPAHPGRPPGRRRASRCRTGRRWPRPARRQARGRRCGRARRAGSTRSVGCGCCRRRRRRRCRRGRQRLLHPGWHLRVTRRHAEDLKPQRGREISRSTRMRPVPAGPRIPAIPGGFRAAGSDQVVRTVAAVFRAAVMAVSGSEWVETITA